MAKTNMTSSSQDSKRFPVSTTSAPGLEMADCCVDVPPVPASCWAISDCKDDLPPVPAWPWAISDCKDDLPPVPASCWAISGCKYDLPPVPAWPWAISDCKDDLPPVPASCWAISGCKYDLPPVPAWPWAISDCKYDLPPVPAWPWAISGCSVNVPHVRPTSQLKQLEDNEIINVGSHSYEMGRKLGEGGFGSVYAGIRLRDGLEVALKFADNMGIVNWIYIEDYPQPVPKEIGLLMLVKKGFRVPEIIQILDWVVEPDRYIMVLECPTPCENLIKFLYRHNGIIEENIVKVIMSQATLAARICCLRGVLHRDIKPENLLINPYTLDVKLIDFGCGAILTDAEYTSFAGTKEYCPPEYISNRKYHGKPATVWSLGILMFLLLCGQFPKSEDLDALNYNNWAKDVLSQECCKLLCSLLQRNPEMRLELENVCLHNWFK